MKITLYGAAGEVTGSAYLVRTETARVLVDCGMFQGGRKNEERNRTLPGLRAGRPDAVVLTHGHLDHIGRLPLLTRSGYRGPIFCTPATVEMAELILRDAVKVQLQDLERTNRKRLRAGQPPLDPAFTLPDVEETLRLFRPAPYREPVAVADGVTATFFEAGHMLGSASVVLEAGANGTRTSAVFSGDLGPRGAPILRDFEPPPGRADVVFLESTYGGRDHKPLDQTIAEFEGIVEDVVRRRGKLLVPTFAVGRTQLLLYLLSGMFRAGHVPRFPVYLDSPMAIEATKIYGRHRELFDEEALRTLRKYPILCDLGAVKFTVTADESRALNEVTGPCLIMAGAGMCNAGRILHHLRQNLYKPETAVAIVGFQVEGSLGRQLVDGAKLVRIFGEPVAVRATIHTLGGFSAHAGQTDLLHWFGALAPSRPQVVLTHGEQDSRKALAAAIAARHGLTPALPSFGESIERSGPTQRG